MFPDRIFEKARMVAEIARQMQKISARSRRKAERALDFAHLTHMGILVGGSSSHSRLDARREARRARVVC
jgi:hypothetical protein